MATISRLRTRDGLSNQCGPAIRARLDALAISNSMLCGRIARATDGMWNPSRLDITNLIHGRRALLTTELVVLAECLECQAAYLLGETRPLAAVERPE